MQAAVPCADAGREGARREKFPRSRAGRDWHSSGVRVEVVRLGHWSSVRGGPTPALPCPPFGVLCCACLPALAATTTAAYAFLARGYLRTSAHGGSDRGTEQGCCHRNPSPYPDHRRGPFISHAHYSGPSCSRQHIARCAQSPSLLPSSFSLAPSPSPPPSNGTGLPQSPLIPQSQSSSISRPGHALHPFPTSSSFRAPF